MKTVRVRSPSDEEWAERQRRRKVIIKPLGRGIAETTVPNAEDVDAALLAKIRVDDTPEVDAFEAVRVVEQLSQADVDDVELAGDAFRLRVPGGATVHLIQTPSAKDVFEYRRCPLDKLDAAQNSDAGTLIRRGPGYPGGAQDRCSPLPRRDPGRRVLRRADPRRGERADSERVNPDQR